MSMQGCDGFSAYGYIAIKIYNKDILYIYIYIYIEREKGREREREGGVY